MAGRKQIGGNHGHQQVDLAGNRRSLLWHMAAHHEVERSQCHHGIVRSYGGVASGLSALLEEWI